MARWHARMAVPALARAPLPGAEQIDDASELGFSRDPFDGLICAAARSLDLPRITRDETIRASGTVRTLW